MSVLTLRGNALDRAGFRHGFSTRGAGDFALLRDPVALGERLAGLAAAVGFDPSRLYQTRQVHGREVVVAEGDAARFAEREADGIVAEPASGAAAGVRVADCVPILLGDTSSGRVAAVHAGWRGVVAEIAAVAMTHMSSSAVVAAIGPCIGACCFEVGEDVATKVGGATVADVVARRDTERGKAWIDLRRGVRAQLVALGVPNDAIDDVGGCTRCDAEQYHSFRRDGDASGRLIGVIVAR